ncbi:hypothetical protein D3C71_1241680 [compost metagenome]
MQLNFQHARLVFTRKRHLDGLLRSDELEPAHILQHLIQRSILHVHAVQRMRQLVDEIGALQRKRLAACGPDAEQFDDLLAFPDSEPLGNPAAGRNNLHAHDLRSRRQPPPPHVFAEVGQPRQRLLDLRLRHKSADTALSVQQTLLHQLVDRLPDREPVDFKFLRELPLGRDQFVHLIGPGLDFSLDQFLDLVVERDNACLVDCPFGRIHTITCFLIFGIDN